MGGHPDETAGFGDARLRVRAEELERQLDLERFQPMRLDDWMPASIALVRERHALRISAGSEAVYRSLWEADFGGLIANTLLGLRAIPSWVANRRVGSDRADSGRSTRSALTLPRFLDAGFAKLEEVPNEELVLGLTGRFWTPTGGLVATRLDTFRAGPEQGLAQAAWNFHLSPTTPGVTELLTETRVRVAEDARASFQFYWTVVRPFSGLLRRAMLRDVRRAAERRLAATG